MQPKQSTLRIVIDIARLTATNPSINTTVELTLENHSSTCHSMKYLLKLDSQDDFCDISSRELERGFMATCNICGSEDFRDFNGRPLVQCAKCRSLERHRVCFEVYRTLGLLDTGGAKRRVLHLAPEKILADHLTVNTSIDYIPSDADPSRYPWAKVLRIVLPDGFRIFPDCHFDYIICNHVLEHIPGHWKDHISEFKRLLTPGGKMIFTVPGPVMSKLTMEGGELLSDDAERLARFGQIDHVRQFGGDLPTHLSADPEMLFKFDSLPDARRAELNVKPASNRVLIWSKKE